MRGTLHFVAAGDLGWMLDLLAGRVLRASAGRRLRLGLDEAQLERGRRLAVGALAGGSALSRQELFRIWDDAGLDTSGQRGIHILQYLALTGTVVFGPTRDGRQLLVLSAEWIGAPRRLEREEALGELAWRYFSGHGPATLADLARWAGLTMTDARAGLARLRSRSAPAWRRQSSGRPRRCRDGAGGHPSRGTRRARGWRPDAVRPEVSGPP